jgi:hypothetical protein
LKLQAKRRETLAQLGVRILSLSEAVRELRYSKAYVHNSIAGRADNVPHLSVPRIGRRLLIRYGALMEWLMSLKVASSRRKY